MSDSFDIIIKKLEVFIKKYYLYKMIKGIFFIVGLYIFIVLFESLIEYFNYLSISLKTFLFFFSIVSFGALLLIYFVFPLLSLLKFRKTITNEDASRLISKHFPEIDDQLLNALELNNLQRNNVGSHDLILASINRRTEILSPYPFSLAINFSQLKKNLLFFGISLIVLLFILAFTPGIISKGTSRLINYSVYYEPEAPFQFMLLNEKLVCERGKDFTINLKVEGDYLPDDVFVKLGDNQFLMNKQKKLGYYQFVIRNINNTSEFKFYADKYYSKDYLIEVLPSPIIKSFTVDIIPPAYTGIEPRKDVNTGDLTVPFGSVLSWTFNTVNVDNISFISSIDTLDLKLVDNVFNTKKQILKDVQYSIKYKNSNFESGDNINYSITVIPDQFPEIDMKQVGDSLIVGAYYFMIGVKDDYGFYKLDFVTNLVKGDSILKTSRQNISFNTSTKYQDVFYYYNFNDLEISDGDLNIEYFFEVRDNDYINGYKPARTSSRIFKPLTNEEIRSNSDEYSKKTDDAINKSKELTVDLQKEIEEFKRKELRGEVDQYEKQNFLKNVMEKQKKIDELLNEALEQNKNKNSLNNQFYDEQKEIMEKQKQIQELLDEILDDELKQLLKEIEELSKEFNEKKFDKLKEKLDLSYKDMNKKLERSLELLKRYQVEEKISHLSEDLKELSEKQESLSYEQKSKKEFEKELEKQENVNKEFDNIKDEFKNTFEKNQELKSPYKMDNFEKQFENTEQKMDNLMKDMPSNSKKKNSQQQKEISKDMQNMSEQMQDMLNQMSMQAMDMNMQGLRQIIDNLSTFSFNQEDNYNLLNKNFANSSKYPDVVSNQNKIQQDFEVIRDSLNMLAGKIPQMNQIITKEVEKLNFDLQKITEELEAAHRRTGLTYQRQILNSTNTLALYLEELMQQMQNQMQSSSGGKSGQKMPSNAMQNLKQQQEKLKKELEQLLEKMKQNGGKESGDGVNEQIVKTLAEQEIFNKMLKDLQNGKTLSPEGEQKLKEIKKLTEKNIDDLINKNITPELYKRNEQIKTRLLEAEKSEREREQEKKRESKEGKKKDMEVPEELKESLKNNKNYKETLKKNNLNMKKYYQNLSNEYFRIINN